MLSVEGEGLRPISKGPFTACKDGGVLQVPNRNSKLSTGIPPVEGKKKNKDGGPQKRRGKKPIEQCLCQVTAFRRKITARRRAIQ